MKDAGIYATFTIIETLLTVIVPYFPIKENIKKRRRTKKCPAPFSNKFAAILGVSSISPALPRAMIFRYCGATYPIGIGRGGKIERTVSRVRQSQTGESQCSQTIVCDCELPAFAPARTSNALLRGSAVRDESAAAKHQAYTV